jgi:hypothetical protein
MCVCVYVCGYVCMCVCMCACVYPTTPSNKTTKGRGGGRCALQPETRSGQNRPRSGQNRCGSIQTRLSSGQSRSPQGKGIPIEILGVVRLSLGFSRGERGCRPLPPGPPSPGTGRHPGSWGPREQNGHKGTWALSGPSLVGQIAAGSGGSGARRKAGTGSAILNESPHTVDVG